MSSSRSRLVLALAACMVVSGCAQASGPATRTTSPSESTPSPVATPSGTVSATSSATTESTPSQPAPLTKSEQASPAVSKGLHHPAFGSAERKAILNGLRPGIERDLHQRVIFEVHKLSVQDGFAYVDLVPRKPSGAKIDYSKTRYSSEFRNGDLDGGPDAPVLALLRYRQGTWHIVTFEIGPTDVAYADWWRRFGAPKAIFPYNE